MTNTYATAEECRQLFALMDQVKALAPWEWMTEIDIFGVQAADAEEPDYISVMGMAGEHFAIALYPGDRPLMQLLQLEQAQPFGDPMDILLIPQFQASFEDRNMLTDTDRQMLKTLGLKYRGRNAWPLLRAHQPACLPWYIESADVQRIANALQQLLDVAPRVKEDPDILVPAGEDEFLVRRASGQGDQQRWQDTVVKPTLSVDYEIELTVDVALMERVAALPLVTNILEVDLSIMPAPVAEKDERPFFPYMLMVVESESGMVLGMEILSPRPSLQAMWQEVPNKFLQVLMKLGVLPQVIRVDSELLASLLQGLEQLDLQIELVDELPGVEEAKEGMMGFLSGNVFG
jgi:hypothetical protein